MSKPIFAIKHRDTGSHGYYSLPAELMQLIPAEFRQREYEEDLEYVIPVVALKDICDFQPYVDMQKRNGNSYYSTVETFIHDCCDTMKNWFPHAYTKLTSEKVTAKESHVLARIEWCNTYVGFLIGFSAITANDKKDFVKVWVAECTGVSKDGYPQLDKSKEIEIYVPSDEYKNRGFYWVLGKPERLAQYEKVCNP